ncbi:MAG: hypothetical protein RI911_326 [Candidatus Parcubacteria bacterium]|jgi:catechol 2,3-dioxygenase
MIEGIHIGHVHLTVSDLERSVDFYTRVLGMEVVARYGTSAAFLSYDGYHHHLGLNTWEGEGIPPQPRGHAGLYHFAILYPTRKKLAQAIERLAQEGHTLDGASDHGVSEAVYLRDVDGIGIELYCDRPRHTWKKDADGMIQMTSAPLDMESLMRELKPGSIAE